MKRLTILILVLAIVAGISWAVDFGGSTAVGAVANADEQRVEVDQEIDIDIGPLHVDINGGLDYAGEDILADFKLGAEVSFSVFKIGALITGKQSVPLNEIKAFIDIATGPVGADVDVLLSADAEKDVFQGAEFSAFWNPGPLELRAGYFLTSSGVGEINVPEVFDDGGIYGKIKISY